jgi:DNA polymerase-3 subunit alpha
MRYITKPGTNKRETMQFEKIISIRKVGVSRTLDIEVDSDNHIFYGNGIATSNSHAVSYGVTSYWTAWVKQHLPLHFFSSWLSFSDKDDVGDFISDSKDFDVDIKNPSILLENENFKIVDGKIYCGIGNIKGIGETTAIKTLQMIKDIQIEIDKELKDFSWKEILILLAPRLTKTTFINLVAAGAFSHLNLYRKRMMFEYNQMSSLTGKSELPWLVQNINSYETLAEGIEALIKAEVASKGRIPKIDSCLKVLTDKSFTTVDDEVWISSIEEELIGGSLSCSKLDVCDTTCGDTTCSEFESRDTEKKISIACQVNRVSLYTPKNGKKMLYVTLKDTTGSLEAVVFSDNVEKVESVFYKGNTVCVTGKKTQKGSLSVYDAIQI